MLQILAIFFIWRLLLFLPLLFNPLNNRPNTAYTNLWYFTQPYAPVSSSLLYPWANFDGVHYLSIAGNGYTYTARFFPLYPAWIRAFSLPLKGGAFGSAQFFSGLFVSNVAFLLALVVLYRLFTLDYSEKRSFDALLYVFVFPTAFFFGSIYSESLFLLCSVCSIYFARKNNWLLAVVFGICTALTRLVGIGIVFALLFEYFQLEQKLRKKWKLLTLPLILLGPALFSYFNYMKWGNFLQFLQEHTLLGNSRSASSIVFPLQTVFRYFKILLSIPITQFEWWIAALEVAMFFGVCVLFYTAWKAKVRLSYLIFGLFCFLVPVFSGTFTGLPRYVAPLFPIYLALGFIQNNLGKIAMVGIGIVLQVILLMLFSRGYFVA